LRTKTEKEKDFFFLFPDWIDILQDRSLPASLYVYIYVVCVSSGRGNKPLTLHLKKEKKNHLSTPPYPLSFLLSLRVCMLGYIIPYVCIVLGHSGWTLYNSSPPAPIYMATKRGREGGY
jgi:hypothetical protein